MKLASPPIALFLLLCTTTVAIHAQQPGDVSAPESSDHRILLEYGPFDPLLGTLEVPATLRSAADTSLWIVQFPRPANDADREAVRSIGGRIVQYMPNDGYIVQMSNGSAASCAVLKEVRWVGPYQPAYRVEPFLFQEHVTGAVVPLRKYNMVMADKRGEKNALQARIQAIGGKVTDRHDDGLLMTAELTGAQMLLAARFDEVLWIDRWSAPELDMNNARIQGGANAVEAATFGGYTGTGVRGHVYEGLEATHPDFNTNPTNVLSGGAADTHGHCTAGIVFGNGASHVNSRGMAPDAIGFYTNYNTPVGSRNSIINAVVNSHGCMFTTASWGGATGPAYTAVSADADDIVFDHRIPWTNSMSNLGNTNVRPEAWAKNVISIGGVAHGDNSSALDDSWLAGNGSIGPAADGRNKPDLSAYYDDVWTSDRSGAAGYNTAAGVAGNSTSSFGGTSSATPIVAGHNALAIQMYTNHIFNNTPRVIGGTRYQNRPYAQTLKALMITGANPYTPTATNNRREHVGWGFPNLNNLYTRRAKFTVIPENAPITQGSTHTYLVNVLSGETTLKVCMTYLDPQGNVAAAIDRINDLTLRVIAPNGTTSYWGNVGLVGASQDNTSATGGAANTLDTVECVFVTNPTAGNWTVVVTAPIIAVDAHLATGAVDATYALVVNGGSTNGAGCARFVPDAGTIGPVNTIPFGVTPPTTLTTVFAGNTGGGSGGTMFFNVNVTNSLYLTGLDINTPIIPGTRIYCDVYRTIVGGSHIGNELNPAAWTAQSAGIGVAAAVNTASVVELAQPVFLRPGTYGIAVVARNFPHRYTTGTGGNQNYNDANLSISLGAATNSAFGPAVNSPRVANTTLKYQLENGAWTNQRYQTIVRREQLGGAGSISGLAFSAGTTGEHWNSSLLIRMSHVAAGTTLSTTFATNLPTPVTVLNAVNYTWHTIADSWAEIGLQSPFAYNGSSDIVVDIVARGNHHTVPAGFNRGDEPRVYNSGWAGLTPTTGTAANGAQRMRLSYDCGNGNEFGASCGPINADHVGTGAHGTTFTFHLHNGAASAGSIIALGFSNSGTYPLSLTSFGFTNCFSWNDSVASLFYVSDVGGFAQHSIALPNVTTYDGVKIYGQWYQLDATQPGGVTASAYTRLLIGDPF